MKANDLVMILTVALGTGALTVLTLQPTTVDAGNDAVVPAQIQKPKLLSSQGVEMTLTTADGKIPKAGETPVFQLKAVSLTNVLASVFARVTVSESSPASVFSRAIRAPAVFWVDERNFSVGPGETKTMTLTCGTNLPPNKFISVALQDVETLTMPPIEPISLSGPAPAIGRPAKSGITVLTFSTVVPAQTPSLAAAR